MKTSKEISPRKIEEYNITPCDTIFNHIEKPENYLCCKSVNLYDDRWRVNVYSKRIVDGIDGRYISSSYFVHFDKSNGEIRFVLPKI